MKPRHFLCPILTCVACNIMADGFWKALAAYACLHFAMVLVTPGHEEKP